MGGKKVRTQVGDMFMSNNCGEVVVLKVNGSESADIMFINTKATRSTPLKQLYNGKMQDLSLKAVNGRKKTPDSRIHATSYKEWRGVRLRTNFKTQFLNLDYTPWLGASVSPEFADFNGFDSWFNEDPFSIQLDHTGKRYQIDKDILVPGNMLYSRETCCHVPSVINSFFTFASQPKNRLLGVISSNRKKNLFRINIDPWPHTDPLRGAYTSEEEAHAIYKERKEAQARFLAECFEGRISDAVHSSLCSFTIEKYTTPVGERMNRSLMDKYIMTLL